MQEGYQRGPAHTGKFDMVLRGYVWSDEQIINYKRMRDEENLQMLTLIDSSIKDSMEALGTELKEYLKEAGETFPEDEKKSEEKKESNNPLDPLVGIFGGFKEIFSAFGGIKPGGEKKQSLKKKIKGGKSDIDLYFEIEEAKGDLRRCIYQTYKNYKKLHGMITW